VYCAEAPNKLVVSNRKHERKIFHSLFFGAKIMLSRLAGGISHVNHNFNHHPHRQPSIFHCQRAVFLGAWLALLLPMAVLAADTSNEILLWPNGARLGRQNKRRGDENLPADRRSCHHERQQTFHHNFSSVAGSGTGAAVIVAPGGGHSELWIDHEGNNIAK
jgi:hypothetical protein